MKKCLLAIILILAIAIVGQAEERQTVFRGLAWGDPVEKLGECEYLGRSEIANFYKRVNENFFLGPLEVTDIGYGFRNNRLVTIFFRPKDNKLALEILRTKYGEMLVDESGRKEWKDTSTHTLISYWENDVVILIDTIVLDEIITKDLEEKQNAW